MITYGSVCSGIEAATMAWEPLGWQAAWFAEIEKFPSRVLTHHWPGVTNFGDMTQLPTYIRNGWIAAPDVLVGGTPCQAFSLAGLRKGLVDPRGALTIKFVEIANAIDEQRPDNPCVVCWENVPGVLSDKSNAFGCFLAALVGEGVALEPPGGKWGNSGCVLGPQRTATWRILDAQYFGVAQRRRRIFVIASAREGFDPTAVLFEREGMRRDIAPCREKGQEVTPTIRAGAANGSAGHGQRSGDSRDELIVPVMCMAHGQGGAEIRSDGEPSLTCNHEAPIVTVPFAFAQNTRDEVRLMNGDGQIVGALAAEPGMKQTCYVADVMAFQSSQSGVRIGNVHATLDSNNGSRRHNGVIAFEPGIARQNRPAGRFVEECCTTLRSRMGDNQPAVAYDADTHGVHYGLTVRRLMPIECERLQGMPDNHTNIPGAADGPRYKAIGNSKAVPVVRWIGARLAWELLK